MNKITCDVCLDLIPLVQDGIASEDSRKAVEQHICTCRTCSDIYDGKTLPAIDSDRIFRKVQKNIWIRIGFVVAVGLVIGVGVFANALVGNPISKMLASNIVERQLATTYADKDFYVERITYSFKDGYYHAFIESESSIDSHFTISVDMYGEVKRDSYEDRVLQGWNTSDRLSTEYRECVEAVFASQMFPFYAHIDYGMLEFLPREALELDEEDILEYALIIEDLKLDGLYDVQELGKEAGHIVLYVYNEEVSVERAAEILLEVKKQMDAGGVNFYVIDFVLEYPKPEDGGHWKEGRVETMEFLSDDIYEDGMIERVYEANEKAIAYHAARDAEMKE